jgi:hypothetical protein
MYTLFKREDENFKYMASCLESNVKARGEAINADPENKKNPVKYITEIIALKKEYDEIIKDNLGNALVFQTYRDVAFRHFLNTYDLAAQFLAIFSDKELRNTKKNA